jgi:hypothetical protein
MTRLQLVKSLIKYVNIDAKGGFLLGYATLYGHTQIVKLLLNSGANLHVDDDFCIFIASRKGFIDIVKLLIHFGANIRHRTYESIRIASFNGNLSIVKLLYWKYSETERVQVQYTLPHSQNFWDDINNCDLLLHKLPYELVELIKRQI